MTIRPTEDYALVRSVMTHPRVYPHISDDGSPAAADFEPIQEGALYLAAYDTAAPDQPEFLGVWMLHAHNAVCWEVHTALLPEAWGPRAAFAVREMFAWVWANTGCRRLITNVPAPNRLALRFARSAGMLEFGRNERSFLKDGILHDQILLGLSRPA